MDFLKKGFPDFSAFHMCAVADERLGSEKEAGLYAQIDCCKGEDYHSQDRRIYLLKISGKRFLSFFCLETPITFSVLLTPVLCQEIYMTISLYCGF